MQGKQKSKFFEEQRTQVNGSDVPVMALRFKEVHMMWLTCDAVSLIKCISLKNKFNNSSLIKWAPVINVSCSLSYLNEIKITKNIYLDET